MNNQKLIQACATCYLSKICLPVGLATDDMTRLDNIITKRRVIERGEAVVQEGEEFSNDAKFIEIKRLHDKVHRELQLFVDSSTEEERRSYMDIVYQDIDELFIVMEKLKNEHKNNIEIL